MNDTGSPTNGFAMPLPRPEYSFRCDQLSQRQKECLMWTAQGKSSWDISRILSISENTVNFHIKNAMRKLGTTSRTAAVAKAIGHGLIAAPQR